VVSHDRDFLDRVATSTIASEGDGNWVEYAGGYSDMVAQRGFGVRAGIAPTAERPKASASPPRGEPRGEPRAEPAARPKRLSFKEKHALGSLPGQIAGLQADIARYQRVLTDPNLYAKDPQKFQQTTQRLADAEQAVAAAEEQWLTLEMLREELDA
jgi:ABC transport system ATP-binding/permease protein